MAQRLIAILVIIAATLAAINGNWNWTLTKGFLASASLLVAATFVATYRLQKQIDDMRDGVPNLICTGTSHDTVPIRHIVTGAIYGIPTFYHIKIANEPRGSVDKEVAKMVSGRVEILLPDRTQVCALKLHRWRHSAGPAEAGKSADILQSQDIQPNGIEVLLDIAMKYDAEDAFYTPTNDTVEKGYDGWRDTRYEFKPGEYIARIRLVGSNVATTLECRIINKGSGKKLELQPIAGR